MGEAGDTEDSRQFDIDIPVSKELRRSKSMPDPFHSWRCLLPAVLRERARSFEKHKD